jgi:hypothetical protein
MDLSLPPPSYFFLEGEYLENAILSKHWFYKYTWLTFIVLLVTSTQSRCQEAVVNSNFNFSLFHFPQIHYKIKDARDIKLVRMHLVDTWSCKKQERQRIDILAHKSMFKDHPPPFQSRASRPAIAHGTTGPK